MQRLEVSGAVRHIYGLLGFKRLISRPGHFTPRKERPIPIEWETWWAPEQVWTFLRRESLLSLLGIELQSVAQLLQLLCYPDQYLNARISATIPLFFCVLIPNEALSG